MDKELIQIECKYNPWDVNRFLKFIGYYVEYDYENVRIGGDEGNYGMRLVYDKVEAIDNRYSYAFKSDYEAWIEEFDGYIIVKGVEVGDPSEVIHYKPFLQKVKEVINFDLSMISDFDTYTITIETDTSILIASGGDFKKVREKAFAQLLELMAKKTVEDGG